MSGDDARPAPPGTPDELAARMERKNAELRVLVRQTAGPGSGRRSRRGRTLAAVVLILGGALLVPASIIAHWAQRTLTDTERYVATVRPLAADPEIRSALADQLTEEVMAALDVGSVVQDAAGALGEQGVSPPVTAALGALEGPVVDGVASFVHGAATRLVESDAFATVWVEANRTAHELLVAIMRADEDSVLRISDQGEIVIQLGDMIERLKAELVDSGLALAASIPAVDATYTLAETPQLLRLRGTYELVVVLGTWLPWLSAALLAVGVLVAARRARALLAAGLAMTGGALLVAVALSAGRQAYLEALSDQIARLDAADAVLQHVVSVIRLSVRSVGVLGLVLAATGFLAGGGEPARSVRAGLAARIGRAREWSARRGASTTEAAQWLDRHRAVIRTTVICVAALVLIISASPTPGMVLAVAGATILLVALVEIVARPPAEASDPA